MASLLSDHLWGTALRRRPRSPLRDTRWFEFPAAKVWTGDVVRWDHRARTAEHHRRGLDARTVHNQRNELVLGMHRRLIRTLRLTCSDSDECQPRHREIRSETQQRQRCCRATITGHRFKLPPRTSAPELRIAFPSKLSCLLVVLAEQRRRVAVFDRGRREPHRTGHHRCMAAERMRHVDAQPAMAHLRVLEHFLHVVDRAAGTVAASSASSHLAWCAGASRRRDRNQFAPVHDPLRHGGEARFFGQFRATGLLQKRLN